MMAGILTILLLGIAEPAVDLSSTGAYATRHQLPILLYVSRSDCTFCRRFEEDVLGPLVRSGVFDDQAVILELMWDRTDNLIDFAGRTTTPEALAEHYQAKLTPTLLFLDGQGRPLQSRIVGYADSVYASYYLEKALKDSRAKLIKRHTTANRP